MYGNGKEGQGFEDNFDVGLGAASNTYAQVLDI
jgi:hypothetical protein